jgi:hypothetical protein
MSYVQSASVVVTVGAASFTTPATDFRGCDYIVVVAEGQINPATTVNAAITDSSGNTWTQIASNIALQGGVNANLTVWRSIKPLTSSAQTFTVTWTGGSPTGYLDAVGFVGRDAGMPEDPNAFGADSAAVSSHNEASVQTTQASDDILAWYAFGTGSASVTFTPGTGWTRRTASTDKHIVETRDNATQASIQATFTTSATRQCHGITIGIRAAGVASDASFFSVIDEM